MVQGAKHMKSNNAAANGGSSPQPKPQPKPKRRRKRLPRWADRLITIVIILIGVGLMTWPWILDRLEASGVFNQISTPITSSWRARPPSFPPTRSSPTPSSSSLTATP